MNALTPEQAAYLLAAGDFTREELAETEVSVARGDLAAAERATRQQAIDASFSGSQVADLLGGDEEFVENLRSAGDLYAFPVDGEFRFGQWQFTSDPKRPCLPGLRALIAAFPGDWHPAGILAFMTTPKSRTRFNGVAVTPIQWLLADGDPEELIKILDSFLQS